MKSNYKMMSFKFITNDETGSGYNYRTKYKRLKIQRRADAMEQIPM